MKSKVLFLILTVFLGELVFDSSTAFVRCIGTAQQKLVQTKTSSPTAGDERSGDAKSKSVAVIGASHAALPVLSLSAVLWKPFVEDLVFAEFLIPSLTPPRDRIERPPIA